MKNVVLKFLNNCAEILPPRLCPHSKYTAAAVKFIENYLYSFTPHLLSFVASIADVHTTLWSTTRAYLSNYVIPRCIPFIQITLIEVCDHLFYCHSTVGVTNYI